MLALLLALAAQDPGHEAALPTPADLPEIAQLPEPFVHLDGTRVDTAADWPARRAELRRLFEHYVYGYAPPARGVRARSTGRVENAAGGRGTLEQFELTLDGLEDGRAPRLHLALFLPAQASAPVPVVLGLNKCGNHTVTTDAALTVVERPWTHGGCRGLERGAKADTWCVPLLLERGYGVATFAVADADPDKADRGDGLHPWFDDVPGEPGERWGTLRAWAWALSRAVDHLETDPRVDPERIVVWGHSRRGKAALLAAAFDDRIALVAPHQSGTGGCALSRDNDQETVARITGVIGWWFNERFAAFADAEPRLPVDQHLLVALVAPRPLVETVGLQDTWANYESSLRALRAAAPVWELLGAPGMAGKGVLEPGEALEPERAGSLLQVRRDTPHVMDAGYWEQVLDFADLQWTRR